MRVEMGILSFCLAGATGCAVQDVSTAESKKGKRRFSVQREGEIVALFFLMMAILLSVCRRPTIPPFQL